jgi:hypothetical protein
VLTGEDGAWLERSLGLNRRDQCRDRLFLHRAHRRRPAARARGASPSGWRSPSTSRAVGLP